VAIAGVLLVPGVVVGSAVSACCGVEPINLVVADEPDPACLGADVTISGKYKVIPDWDPFEPYDTGYVIRVWDPGAVNIVNKSVTLATDEPTAPKDFSFSEALAVTEVGTYTYEVIAWSYTSFGRMETSIVPGSIAVEACGSVDVKPGSCPNAFNRGEKGVLPVALVGDADFDATLVDPTSVTLNGVPAKMWEIKDTAKPDGIDEPTGCMDCLSYELTPIYDAAGVIIGYEADGIDDLIVYFDAQAVAATLSGAAKGDCVVVTVGFEYAGVDITKTDVLKIVK